MSDNIKFDFSELTGLAADLGEVQASAERTIRSAIEYTSVEIKKSAARKVGKRKHFKQAAQAIDYELKSFQGFGVSVLQSEIGFDKDKPAGALGNLTEFGAPGADNALAPGSELVTSLHEQEGDFVKGLNKALEDAERKAGL